MTERDSELYRLLLQQLATKADIAALTVKLDTHLAEDAAAKRMQNRLFGGLILAVLSVLLKAFI